MVVKNYLKFILEYFKVNMQSAMEYRTSFVTQVLFMIFNDVIWIIFWLIFFNKFPAINGWVFSDLISMYIVITLVWGLLGVFFGNFRDMASIIKEGQLDFYLALPKEELSHLLVSKSRFNGFGDIIFGLTLMVLFIPLVQMPLLALLILFSLMIMLSFCIMLGSLSFYLGSSTELADQGILGALATASYPFSAFDGVTRFILLAIVPVGFLTGIPVELLIKFDTLWFGLLALVAILMTTLSIIVFKIGVRKYESGNLINIRV